MKPVTVLINTDESVSILDWQRWLQHAALEDLYVCCYIYHQEIIAYARQIGDGDLSIQDATQRIVGCLQMIDQLCAEIGNRLCYAYLGIEDPPLYPIGYIIKVDKRYRRYKMSKYVINIQPGIIKGFDWYVGAEGINYGRDGHASSEAIASLQALEAIEELEANDREIAELEAAGYDDYGLTNEMGMGANLETHRTGVEAEAQAAPAKYYDDGFEGEITIKKAEPQSEESDEEPRLYTGRYPGRRRIRTTTAPGSLYAFDRRGGRITRLYPANSSNRRWDRLKK